MGKIKDLTGQKFGKLTALYKLHNINKQGAYWLCVCECGNITEVRGNHLSNGNIKSCGCYRKEVNTIHCKAGTRLYNVYLSMKDRCYNKNDRAYTSYGGRGIVVCQEWLDDFMNFYNWAMDNNYKEGLSIDRIDNNGNYEPNNCQWATRTQQQRNRRNNKNYTINGETHCLAEWCEILNLRYGTVHQRLEYGWPIEKALGLEVKNP